MVCTTQQFSSPHLTCSLPRVSPIRPRTKIAFVYQNYHVHKVSCKMINVFLFSVFSQPILIFSPLDNTIYFLHSVLGSLFSKQGRYFIQQLSDNLYKVILYGLEAGFCKNIDFSLYSEVR